MHGPALPPSPHLLHSCPDKQPGSTLPHVSAPPADPSTNVTSVTYDFIANVFNMSKQGLHIKLDPPLDVRDPNSPHSIVVSASGACACACTVSLVLLCAMDCCVSRSPIRHRLRASAWSWDGRRSRFVKARQRSPAQRQPPGSYVIAPVAHLHAAVPATCLHRGFKCTICLPLDT